MLDRWHLPKKKIDDNLDRNHLSNPAHPAQFNSVHLERILLHDAAQTRIFSLGFAPSCRSEGTLLKYYGRGEAIPLDDATSK